MQYLLIIGKISQNKIDREEKFSFSEEQKVKLSSDQDNPGCEEYADRDTQNLLI